MPMGNEPPQLLKQRVFIQGRKFNFEINSLRLPNKAVGDWECIRHPGGALAIPITHDGKLVLVRQYRFAVQGRLLEFPAGTVEPNETPAQTIEREIQEEVAYKANTWQPLGSFPLAPGYSDEFIHAFLASDLEAIPSPPDGDADEDIEVVHLTPAEFEQAVLDGTGVDAKSIASYFIAREIILKMTA